MRDKRRDEKSKFKYGYKMYAEANTKWDYKLHTM